MQDFPMVFYNWMSRKNSVRIDYSKDHPEALEYLFSNAILFSPIDCEV
jgi:hypothetical protein